MEIVILRPEETAKRLDRTSRYIDTPNNNKKYLLQKERERRGRDV